MAQSSFWRKTIPGWDWIKDHPYATAGIIVGSLLTGGAVAGAAGAGAGAYGLYGINK